MTKTPKANPTTAINTSQRMPDMHTKPHPNSEARPTKHQGRLVLTSMSARMMTRITLPVVERNRSQKLLVLAERPRMETLENDANREEAALSIKQSTMVAVI